MAEGRRREDWNHTASIIAALINSNPFRKPGAKPVSPQEIHPMGRGESAAPTFRIKVSALKGMFDK